MEFATFFNSASRSETIAMRAPAVAKVRAVTSPMPEEAPVISTRRPERALFTLAALSPRSAMSPSGVAAGCQRLPPGLPRPACRDAEALRARGPGGPATFLDLLRKRGAPAHLRSGERRTERAPPARSGKRRGLSAAGRRAGRSVW